MTPDHLCFPQLSSHGFISTLVPAVSTSAPSEAVSSFFLAQFLLAYCFFLPFLYSIWHPFLGLTVFLPYICKAENVKGVITANFKDCQKFINAKKVLRLQRTGKYLRATNLPKMSPDMVKYSLGDKMLPCWEPLLGHRYPCLVDTTENSYITLLRKPQI